MWNSIGLVNFILSTMLVFHATPQRPSIRYTDGHWVFMGGGFGYAMEALSGDKPWAGFTPTHATFVNRRVYDSMLPQEKDVFWNHEFYHTRQFVREYGWGFWAGYLQTPTGDPGINPYEREVYEKVDWFVRDYGYNEFRKQPYYRNYYGY